MELQSQSAFSRFLRRNALALALTAGLFALVYCVVFHFRMGDSDYIDHMIWAVAMTPRSMLASFFNGRERLWHIFVNLLFSSRIIPNSWSCAAVVTAAADAAAYFLVFKTLELSLPEKSPRWLLAVLTACAFVAEALAVPGGIIFSVEKGAVNTWHNPTNLMVRPFAAAIFFMTVKIYNRRRYGRHTVLVTPPEDGRSFSFQGGFWAEFKTPVFTWQELILYPLCLLLATYAKASFLQYFAPAIFLFLIFDVCRTKGMLLPFCLKLALTFVPAVLVIYSQFFTYFDGAVTLGGAAAETAQAAAQAASDGVNAVYTSSGIVVYFLQPSFTGAADFFRALGRSLCYVLCVCAFPLFILLAAPRRTWRSTLCRFGFTGMLVGYGEGLLLHEAGERATHGNFLWGYFIAVWLLWCAAIGQYTLLLREKTRSGKLVRYGGTALLAWHLTTGIVYVTKILQTGLYLF